MIPILMYHQVGQPAPKGTPFRGLTVHPQSFRRQMTWLRRLGYRGLSMHELMPYLLGERQGKVVGITFDDGYQNVFDHALPVLRDCGFSATNYFVVNQIGHSNVWDHDLGIPPSALMNSDTVRRWHDSGMEVGSHTLDHPHLPELSPEIAVQQIRQSREELQALIDRPVTAFCYPYGEESADVRNMARQAGYTNATTTARGLARPDDDLFGLPRVTVARSTHLLRFLQKCLTQLEDRRRKD